MAMDRERPRGRKRRKVCTFCVDKVEHIDYKDAVKLRRFLSRPRCLIAAGTVYDQSAAMAACGCSAQLIRVSSVKRSAGSAIS